MKSKFVMRVIFFLLIANNVLAQTDTKKFYVSGNVNFSLRKSEYFPNSTLPASTKKSFGFSPNFGFLLNKNMIVGFGFSFEQSKTHSFSRINLPYQPAGWNNLGILERKLAPSVFFIYQREAGERFIMGVTNRILFGMEGNHIEDLNQSGSSYSESKMTYGTKFLQASFSPLIQFMLTKNLGIQTNFNLFRVTVKEDSGGYIAPIRTTEFDFSLNPENWEFGLVLYL